MKGEIIKQLRKEKKLTQEELALRLGVSKATIAMIETNKREGSREVETKIANFFGVSRDYLAGATKDRNNTINVDNRKEMINELLEYLVNTGIIKDEENIDEDTQKLIMNTVKTQVALIKKQRGK